MSQTTTIFKRRERRWPGRFRWLLAGLLITLALAGAVLAGNALRAGTDALMGDEAGSTGNRLAVTTAAQIEALQLRLTRDGDDLQATTTLAGLYLQQARETGDASYYGKAETLLDGVLAREGQNVEALAFQGGLALARHEFAAALDWGLRALAVDPDALVVYPVLIDANVELGRYDEAIRLADGFVNLRPDLASYTRVAYLRELHGDTEGAIEALTLALDTVPAATEPGGWTRVQLGNLHFNSGDLDGAGREYARTLALLPEYAPAQAGMARVAAARGDLSAAIELLTAASARVPLPEYVIALGDVYAVAGNSEAAAEQYALVQVMTQLQAANGVNSDLELTLFAADHLEASGLTTEQLVERARAARDARPSIYGDDLLAWVLYRSGDHAAAWDTIQPALRLGTRDATLHFHAGMISYARGDNASARQHLTLALEINPHFSLLHASEARATLAALGK